MSFFRSVNFQNGYTSIEIKYVVSIQKTILSEFSSKDNMFTAVKDLIKWPALFS